MHISHYFRQSCQKENVEVDLALVGAKAVAFFRRMGGNVVGTATHLGDKPSINDLVGSIKIMLDAYTVGKIDRLYLVSNEFVSAMSQTPTVTQLLPASGIGEGEEDLQEYWD